MTVTLTISSAIGGDSISDTVDLGSLTPGGSPSSTQDLYIRHDGVNDITDCELYITRYTGFDYPGTDADADLATLLGTGWGLADKGVKLNMNPTTPAWAFFKDGAGDVEFPITLSQDAIVEGHTTDGEIPAEDNAHIQLGIELPSSSGGARHMAFGLVFAFSSTS
jgi:hypothetical protein